MKQFNHAAIWLTIILHQAILLGWYSLEGLLQPWAETLKVPVKDLVQRSAVPYVIAVFASIITCYLLSWILITAKKSKIGDAIAFSLVLWMGYGGATLAQQYAMVGVGFPAVLLDMVFTMINALVSGVIIGGWMKKTKED